MEFSGIDIVLDRRLEADRIRQGVAAVLSVESSRVSVIDDMTDYPERGRADVVCVVTPTSGEFANVVSIQCEPMELSFAGVLDVVERLSSTLDTKILAPSDGPDPYVMWLVQPDFPRRQVSLDEAALEDDTYEIRSDPDITIDSFSDSNVLTTRLAPDLERGSRVEARQASRYHGSVTTLDELEELEESFATYRDLLPAQRSGEPAKRYVQEPLQVFFGQDLPPGLSCGPGDRPPNHGRTLRDEMDIAIDDATQPWRFRTRYIANKEPVRVHIEVASYTHWNPAKIRDDLDAIHRSIDEAAACAEKCWTGIVLAGGEWNGAAEKIAPLLHEYYHTRRLSRREGIGAPYPYSWPYVDAVVLPGMFLKKHDLIEEDDHGHLPATSDISRWPRIWPIMMPYPLSTQGRLAALRPLAVVRSFLRKYLSNVMAKTLDTELWTSMTEEREVCGPTLAPHEHAAWKDRPIVVCLQDSAPGTLYHWAGERWQPFVRSATPVCSHKLPYMFGVSQLGIRRRTT